MPTLLPLIGLFAFAPRQGALPSGPPPEHLARTPSLQWRLNRQPAWRAFQDRWGGGWFARWDERTATPRFLGAPGIDEQAAEALVADVAALGRVDPRELHLSAVTERADRKILRWTRTWRGVPVEGDQVAIVVTRGRIGAIWARLTPISGLPTPRPGESVISLDGRPALATEHHAPTRVAWTDRAGRVLVEYDPRLFSTVRVSCEERTVGDDLVEAPARRVTALDSGGSSDITDDDGACDLSGALSVSLTGPSLRVSDAGALVTVSGADDFTMVGGEDLSRPAASVQHHTHVVRDWLEARWPEHAWLDDVVQADVNQTWGTCNAYYTSGTINFLLPGSCNNLGQIADVIYHEYGHGVHDYIVAAGTFASDVSEGSADYVSATINDDPNVSPEFYPGAPYLRELDTDKVYPTDVIGESHNDGLIWGSFLWNLREMWIEAYGEEEGVAMTDVLFLGALEQGPQLTDLYEAVLTADDDDGDWSNGTPHDCELIALLDHHGLGPGALGVLQLEYAPLEAQASDATSYPVSLGLYALSADCGETGAPTASAWYSTDDAARPPIGEAGWEDWTELPLTASGDTWSGEIPRVPANSRVRWFIALTSADGSDVETSFGDVPQELDSFWVGDRVELWCDDLEGDLSGWSSATGVPWLEASSETWSDTWVFGAPTGATWKPDAAYSGGVAALTGLEEEYPASNVQHLASPSAPLGDGLMRLLSYRRWLTVEDGFYDQAILWVRDESGAASPLWANPRTDAANNAFLDQGWTLHDVSLQSVPASAGSFLWSLQSDAGLEFGGWAIDDVCVVELDDVPGHYRVDDLRAEVRGERVTLSWSTPWIQPLSASALVMKRGGWPTSLEDGEILLTVESPAWGRDYNFEHDRVVPGESVYYAVFSAGSGADDWYTDVVEGENGVHLGGDLPDELTRDSSPPADTADSAAPEADSSGDVKAEPTCGCGTSPRSSWSGFVLGLGLLALAGARRRRGA